MIDSFSEAVPTHLSNTLSHRCAPLAFPLALLHVRGSHVGAAQGLMSESSQKKERASRPGYITKFGQLSHADLLFYVSITSFAFCILAASQACLLQHRSNSIIRSSQGRRKRAGKYTFIYIKSVIQWACFGTQFYRIDTETTAQDIRLY